MSSLFYVLHTRRETRVIVFSLLLNSNEAPRDYECSDVRRGEEEKAIGARLNLASQARGEAGSAS
jgi:hypothetical protein